MANRLVVWPWLSCQPVKIGEPLVQRITPMMSGGYPAMLLASSCWRKVLRLWQRLRRLLLVWWACSVPSMALLGIPVRR